MPAKKDSETIVRDIKRKTRKKYNAEEKIRILRQEKRMSVREENYQAKHYETETSL